jgi:hypothetical protein
MEAKKTKRSCSLIVNTRLDNLLGLSLPSGYVLTRIVQTTFLVGIDEAAGPSCILRSRLKVCLARGF